MTDQARIKHDKKKDRRKDDPRLQAEVIEDLDVTSQDANALRGGQLGLSPASPSPIPIPYPNNA